MGDDLAARLAALSPAKREMLLERLRLRAAGRDEERQESAAGDALSPVPSWLSASPASR